MYYHNNIVLLTFSVIITFGNGAYEGEPCTKDGVRGTCKNLRQCQPAIDDFKRNKRPQICGFSGTDSIVCCVEATATVAPLPVATTVKQKPVTSTEYVPPVYDYRNPDESTANSECEALSDDFTSKRNGTKSWDKCIDYQEDLVYPCEKSVTLGAGKSRARRCYHNAEDLIIGGVDAKNAEFPHMALLGYGDTAESAQWLCGGSLISDKYILTAGHCVSSRDFGAVTYARLALLRRTDPIDYSRLHQISRIIKHPEYKPPQKYNDIALLETANTIQLDSFTVPACLPVGALNDDRAIATGYGAEKYRGKNANILQKVTLTKFTDAECQQFFPPERLMKQGFQTATQICYGDKSRSKDTCQGDSGGPLQVKSKNIHCMYVVIGVTSFGRACGYVGEPGVYTRVAAYVPWIESIVWP